MNPRAHPLKRSTTETENRPVKKKKKFMTILIVFLCVLMILFIAL